MKKVRRAAGPRKDSEELAALIAEQRADVSTVVESVVVGRSQRGENHSEGEAPKGHRFIGDLLVKSVSAADAERSPRVTEVAKALLVALGDMFTVPDERPRSLSNRRPLGQLIRALLAVAEPRLDAAGGEIERAKRVEAAFVALTGRAFGTEEWWEKPLETQLEMNARRRVEHLRRAKDVGRRVRLKRKGATSGQALRARVELLGDRLQPEAEIPLGALDAFVGPKEIRKFIEHVGNGRTLPRELSDERLQKMIDATTVGANRGGRGGKKTASSLVAEFKAKLVAKKKQHP